LQTSLLGRIGHGFLGGIAGSFAMNTFARVMVAFSGREAPGAAPGQDRIGRGVQPPQSTTTADRDAAVLAGAWAFRAAAGRQPRRRTALKLGAAAHYLFGAGAGIAYAVLAPRCPALRRGRGAVYGALVWAAADEVAMPALGISRAPHRIAWPVHAYALIGHFVYAAALDGVVKPQRQQ
jgi:hypothetical protein